MKIKKAPQVEECSRLIETIVENSQDAIIGESFDGIIISWNAGAEKMFGYSAEEVIGKTVKFLYPPEIDGKELKNLIDKIKQDELIAPYDSIRICKDGHKVDVEISVSPIKERDGAVVGMSIIERDITRRKLAEKALRESNELLSLYISNSPIYAFIKSVTSTESRVIKASRNFVEMIGKLGLDITGKTMTELFPAEFAAKITADDWAVVSSGKALEVNEDFNGRNYITIKFPIRQGDKNLLAGYTIDITDRKKAEEELAAKTMLLNAQLEMSIDGILAVDNEGHTIILNKHFGEMWKIPQEILDTKDDKAMLSSIMKQLKNPEEFGRKVEYLYKHQDEKSRDDIEFIDGRWFDRYSSPLIGESGKFFGRIWFFRDITEQKKIDIAKTEFVSLASHQLRTPLSAINWYIETLNNEEIGSINAKQKEYLGEIYSASQRMAKLVGDLLNLSRIEFGLFSVEPEPIDIVKITKMVIKEVQGQIIIRRQKLIENYESNLGTINVDKNLTWIILQNLLSNAVKYTPDKGTISLTIQKEKEGNNLFIAVADNGYGIPLQQQSRIFEKFFRADNVREKNVESTGLGLYIVKQILEKSGGTIRLESIENKGTTFFVSLPLKGMTAKEGSKKLIAG